ncbi:hypothetical protein R1flu_019722 [Riccia fluitans]|uniref:2-(3-amino-3-carboxypropyl)histidine synthase subunit 2 n=1 Tax=Riccia fluitans TaxID=41844 RepID=A0ABD1ZMY9_9MARC
MGTMDQKEFWQQFDITATAAFIIRNCFQRIALQFPDELLKYSVEVVGTLKKEIGKQRNVSSHESVPVKLFVMADTTFGSCCADEVAAMHADAQCIVHYGNACLSRTSRLPVWYVFGRASLDVEDCSTQLLEFASKISKPVLVLFGLEYSPHLLNIQQKLSAIGNVNSNITFADVPSQCVLPSSANQKHEKDHGDGHSGTACEEHGCSHEDGGVESKIGVSRSGDTSHLTETCSCTASEVSSSGQSVISQHSLGGLKWIVQKDKTMEDYTIFWIGDECAGLTNVTLVYNTSSVVRYDCSNKKIFSDVPNQSKTLRRRYYCVERAKDANIVGIVVGTLGVAGYADVIQNVRKMVESAGKKAYTLVMGKPNPAKLANFPECEVFVLVACPQTALIDNREYLAPLLTPFEAELAFIEGNQWTGAYALEFNSNLGFPTTSEKSDETKGEEPRFSFFSGGYVDRKRLETKDLSEDGDSQAIVLSKSAEHALQLRANPSLSIITTERAALNITSGAEYLASRTYQGLDISEGGNPDFLALPGRKGRAAGYKDETTD